MLHPLINKLLHEKGKQPQALSPEMTAVLSKLGTQLEDYEKQIKFLEHTSSVVEDEYENLYQQLKETNNRLNNFLEEGDIVYHITYKHKKSNNFFTSNWKQFFGFDPQQEKDPISKRRSLVVPSMQGYFDRQMIFLEKSGAVTMKYQIEHPVTHAKIWLEEEIKKRSDALLKDEYYLGKIVNVTNRELYEEVIKETESRFKNITDAIPVMIWVSDHNNHVIYSNNATKEFYGMGLEGIESPQEFEKFIHPDFLHLASTEWEKRLEKHQPLDFEFRVKNKEGEYRYLRQVAIPRHLENGQFLGFVGASFDLTNEYNYKIELEDDKRRFELVMNSSLDAIICMNLDGVITLWNPQAEKIFEWKEQEVIGKRMSDVIIPQQYGEAHEKGLKHYLKTGEQKVLNRVVQINGIKKDGSEVPLELSIIHVKSEKGDFFCSYIRDITERKNAYDALKTSEQKYRSLFENMTLGILEVDNQEKIIYANKSFEDIVGYSSKEMEGQNAAKLFIKSPEQLRRIEEVALLRKQGKDSVYEVSLCRKDGTLAQVVISGAPTFEIDGSIKGSVGIHWDVTEIRRTQQELLDERITREQKLLETKLQAEEEQRAQIGRDLHDGVGQMLAYMQLYIGLVKSNHQFGDKEIGELEKTVDKTLQQVRTLSRSLAPPSIRDLGLRDAIVELVESYAILERPKFHLKIYPHNENRRLKLEQKIMLYRVLQELISNTFKYADADNVRIKYSFIKNDLLFEYEDDGKGFDLVHVKKGVGLDSIRSRVEFYKGSLKYEAAPGRGMTAVILLPVAE
ncbi:MAG: PAS domain S-box protein [Chitinophagia bacterium]|nr:PAS domain S-box protein [Chitinophagia bacterium]